MAGDDRVACRWARRDQRLDVDRHLTAGGGRTSPRHRWPSVVDALERVGGFVATRTGGDVDLCWRVQLAGLGGVVAAPDSPMRCEPRESVRAVLRQWARYGRGHLELYARFHADGCPVPDPTPRRALLREVGVGRRRLLTRRRRDPGVEAPRAGATAGLGARLPERLAAVDTVGRAVRGVRGGSMGGAVRDLRARRDRGAPPPRRQGRGRRPGRG